MAIAMGEIGQAEWTDYVADMAAQEEAFWAAEFEREAAERREQEEADYVYFFLDIPTLCSGCPLFEAWQEQDTERGIAMADTDEVILSRYCHR